MRGSRSVWRRIDPPTTANSKFLLISFWDIICAVAAPLLAIFLRRPDQFLSGQTLHAVEPYVVISSVVTIVTFIVLRTGIDLTRYFSAADAFNLIKYSAVAVALSSLCAFIMMRLDGVSRTVPVIHFLLLCLLLLVGRLVARMSHRGWSTDSTSTGTSTPENIILIGINHAAWLYIQFVDEMASSNRRIVAILDDRPKFWGRKLVGHAVVGGPDKLHAILQDFELHGIPIDTIVLAQPSHKFSQQARTALEEAAHNRQISVESITQHAFDSGGNKRPAPPGAVYTFSQQFQDILDRPYWGRKHAIEFVLSLAGIVVAAVPMMTISVLVAISLGTPIFFWQQRIGFKGIPITIRKFRTLRSPEVKDGHVLDPNARQTTIGRLLRASRLDELPQLFSILNGTMSIVGPRPLLPADQPDESDMRLLVRPGMTGYAQVCGGKLLTAQEKGALDDWYVLNASAWLDAKILLSTLKMMIHGDMRNEYSIASALDMASQRRKQTPEIAQKPKLSQQQEPERLTEFDLSRKRFSFPLRLRRPHHRLVRQSNAISEFDR